ncbi:MAG: DUF6569 family protein [Acidobacteriota bacterium]|jgi:hypothetical protein
MKQIIDQALGVKIGVPATFKNMTVFPLVGKQETAADYLTLDEALAQKLAAITEVSEGGSVPELKFVNSSDKKVFLLDGEELVGAKQNRVLNLSIMVPVGKTLVVPVSCVEAGRWHHRSREFSSAPRAHYAEGRARKMAQVSDSMKTSGRRTSNQGEVWNHINEKFSRFGSSSPTSAMSDIYEQQSVRLEDYVRSFTPAGDQVGAVFAIGGDVVGLELFDSPETLQKLFAKLLRSYGLDALDRARSDSAETRSYPIPTKAKASAFLRKVTKAKEEEFPALGEGQDLRLTGPRLTGAALAVDGRVVHLSAFAMSQ